MYNYLNSLEDDLSSNYRYTILDKAPEDLDLSIYNDDLVLDHFIRNH